MEDIPRALNAYYKRGTIQGTKTKLESHWIPILSKDDERSPELDWKSGLGLEGGRSVRLNSLLDPGSEPPALGPLPPLAEGGLVPALAPPPPPPPPPPELLLVALLVVDEVVVGAGGSLPGPEPPGGKASPGGPGMGPRGGGGGGPFIGPPCIGRG